MAFENRQSILYEQLRAELAGYAEGGKFMPQNQIVHKYQVSVTTVRIVLAQLKKEGFLESRRGSGHYVTRRIIPGVKISTGKTKIKFVIFKSTVDPSWDDNRQKWQAWLEKADRGISIDIESVETVDHEKILIKLYSSCDTPVVFYSHYFARFALNGLLTDFSEIDQNGSICSRLHPHSWRLLAGPDGVARQYYLPFTLNPRLPAVNLELARKAGVLKLLKNGAETDVIKAARIFEAWRNRHKKNSNYRFSFSPVTNFISLNILFSWLWRMNGGGEPVDFRTGELLLQGESGEAWFGFFKKIIPYLETNFLSRIDAFTTGNFCYHFSAGAYLPSQMQRFRPDLQWQALNFPPSLTGPTKIMLGFSGLAVFKPSFKPDHRTCLRNFFELFYSEDHHRRFVLDQDSKGLIEISGLSPLKKLLEPEELSTEQITWARAIKNSILQYDNFFIEKSLQELFCAFRLYLDRGVDLQSTLTYVREKLRIYRNSYMTHL